MSIILDLAAVVILCVIGGGFADTGGADSGLGEEYSRRRTVNHPIISGEGDDKKSGSGFKHWQ